MTEPGPSSLNRPPCSSFLLESLVPETPHYTGKSLNKANQFARHEATTSMCVRCFGEFSIICVLAGPQHADQSIIPDLSAEDLLTLKSNLAPSSKAWVLRILEGKAKLLHKDLPGLRDQVPIIRRSLHENGYPQVSSLATDAQIRLSAVADEAEPASPARIITPAADQVRGVSDSVLEDIGYTPD